MFCELTVRCKNILPRKETLATSLKRLLGPTDDIGVAVELTSHPRDPDLVKKIIFARIDDRHTLLFKRAGYMLKVHVEGRGPENNWSNERLQAWVNSTLRDVEKLLKGNDNSIDTLDAEIYQSGVHLFTGTKATFWGKAIRQIRSRRMEKVVFAGLVFIASFIFQETQLEAAMVTLLEVIGAYIVFALIVVLSSSDRIVWGKRNG